MELFGKEFNEEVFYSTYNGRPNDMLRKACEAGYAKGVIRAFELGANAIESTIKERLTRYGFYTIFFRLMMFFDTDYVDFFRKYKSGDEIPLALQDDVHTALLGLAGIGVDFNELLDAFYGQLFLYKNLFKKDINDTSEESEIYKHLNIFEPTSNELRRYALMNAVAVDNVEGIDYLISLGTNVTTGLIHTIEIAVLNESYKAVEHLIEKGFDMLSFIKNISSESHNHYLFSRLQKLLIFFNKVILRNNKFVIEYYKKAKTDPFVKEYLLTKELEIKYQRFMRKEQKRQAQSSDNKTSTLRKRKRRKNKRL